MGIQSHMHLKLEEKKCKAEYSADYTGIQLQKMLTIYYLWAYKSAEPAYIDQIPWVRPSLLHTLKTSILGRSVQQ